MNHSIFKMCIILLITACFDTAIHAQTTTILAEQEIKLIMKIQESNWNMGNIKGFMNGYLESDSLLFIGSKGPTYGFYNTLENYNKSYPTPEKMGTLKFDFIKIEVITDSDAFVVGSWQLTRKDDHLIGYFSLLWKKIDGQWKIIVDHSS